MMKRVLPFAAVLSVAGAAQADTFHVTFEAPGVQTSTASFSSVGIETFDGVAQGASRSFTTDFGSGGVITGSYAGVDILGADQYGGAGGAGNFASTFSGYSLGLSTSDPAGINYFGFWLSALDSGNTVTFSRAGSTLFSFTPVDVLALVGGNPAYFGNPNAGGANGGQPYVFLNFFDTDGAFDTVTFSEGLANAGYESDNHTVGFYTAQSGTPVPEPAAWATMILGFAGVGAMARRRVGLALRAG
ncbi:MAG: PEPxxWA-CTERM sorting domain-containing protein [Alphaproteobacteria bacterium]|nr:PEPxxWA-CTERM sorting domain-containing protein [Alphaproteobacteria bacterium]MBU1512721.1 PEPxxWA-CTERM sorting domain-containing protein [Alphaproteobacteria bacterium]MBU2096100.1 PEPxxWA-CTERM sorting domain-containing protein [Alphaproteobacteria bacterium]MBU2152456.1 PEPxxWA-CTERM sorting domain-containing protein [Alphaproteobacteria bacterium]MBU2362267.1 PEPxxWA-CTERM sorting domain-containing protein [Alphaproteobacteria bacterium]